MRKITVQHYATAFVAALKEKKADKDKLIKNFLALIRSKSDWFRREKIVSAVKSKLREDEGKQLLTVESARALGKKQIEIIENAYLPKKYDIEYRLNQNMIAGVKLTIDGKLQLDGSLARKLNDMFQK